MLLLRELQQAGLPGQDMKRIKWQHNKMKLPTKIGWQKVVLSSSLMSSLALLSCAGSEAAHTTTDDVLREPIAAVWKRSDRGRSDQKIIKIIFLDRSNNQERGRGETWKRRRGEGTGRREEEEVE